MRRTMLPTRTPFALGTVLTMQQSEKRLMRNVRRIGTHTKKRHVSGRVPFILRIKRSAY